MTHEHEPGPDQELEGQVGAWLSETDLSHDEASAGLDRLLYEFPVTPQTRRRFLGRWLDRDEGAGSYASSLDRPSGSRRRERLVLSATGITAALAILALAVSIADFEQAPPDTQLRELVVAADGSGGFTTIAAAVAAARDGDTVTVRPGTYAESILVDKDITLAGSGPRAEVVITAPADGPIHRMIGGPNEPYAIALMGSDAHISGLTLAGERSSLLVDGGDPTLRDLHFLDVTEPFGGAGKTDLNALVIAGGSSATLTDSLFERSGPLGVYESDPLIIGNEFRGGSHIWGRFGDDAVIVDNQIDGALSRAIGVLGSGSMLIEGNVITGHATGIEVGSKGDTAARIRHNRIVDAHTGISARDAEAAEISGNELIGTGIGVQVAHFDGPVADNAISGGDAGIVVVSGGAPRVADNVIDVSGRGIVAGARTNPVISGNEVCGGDASIRVADGATPLVVGNETCEGKPSTS